MDHQDNQIFGKNQTIDQESILPLGISGIALSHQVLMHDRDVRLASKHEIEIKQLKRSLQEKDKEIEDLQQKLKEVNEKNNDLQIKLNTKDREVEQLKQRIQTLEDEKKDLQDELSRVETKLKRLENEVKTLNKSSRSHEEENKKLKEDLQRVEYSLKTTETKLTTENEKLKKEVKQLKETQVMPMLEPPRVPLPPTFQSMALLHFGELCWQIQGKMYKKVLPKHYVPVRSYKVKNIDKDVKKLAQTDEERNAAKERWKVLKSKLNWSEELEEAIKSLQDSRNIEAHPRISESSLLDFAKVLEKDGILKGWLSLERVSELIEIWKPLSHQVLMHDRDVRLASKHEIEIKQLKRSLQEKDKEIEDLQQKLKEVNEKNHDLLIKLNTKDREVEQLKQRIQALEDEKKDLEDELSRVETKLKRLENEVKTLNKSSRSHEEENQKLKEDLQKVEYSLKTTQAKLTTENEKLKKEVKQLKETHVLPMLEPPRVPLPPTIQSRALLHFGELCCQIQGKMYKKVLPKHYVAVRSYKVKNIEKDVKKLAQTDEERTIAKERWEVLKSKLNWSEELEEAIKSLQDSRNVEAHPRISESSLHEYATVLEEDGILKGWLSLERVNELIEIWKRLKCEEE
ncbi:hypothetical protein AC249_AIPGENE24848 [Exaiptasia diaphana]|nr:hypothetical protein AC249_AIPGENE24848 [Exaiptasia diaphana]